MQRQSLGSPGSKLHSHGVAAAAKEEKTLLTLEDPKRNNGGSSSTLSLIDHGEEKDKITKPHNLPSKPEKFIHLIPILTLLCFLVLYLCSHDPSQSDLAHFHGFKRSSKSVVDAAKDSHIGRFLEINRGDVLAIRSLKNLQEIKHAHPKSRLHRKIGEF